MTISLTPLRAVQVPMALENGQIGPRREYNFKAGQIYEVFRVHKGKPIFLEQHLQRMAHSAQAMGLQMPDEALWKPALLQLCAKQTGTQNMKLVLETENEHAPSMIAFFIESRYPTEEQIREGVPVTIIEGERSLPHIKRSGHAIRKTCDKILADGVYYEVLLRNRRDEITEGSRSSLLLVRDGAIYTPPLADVLPGITRSMVIHAAMRLGLQIHAEPIRSSDLASFHAAAILGTSPGVLPISAIVPMQPSIMHAIPYDPDHPILRKLRETYIQQA